LKSYAIRFIFLFGLIIAYIIFALDMAMKKNTLIWYIIVVVGVIGFVILVIRFVYIYKKSIDRDFERCAKSGVLDWDIYDNGILVKYYSKKPTVSVEQDFMPFENISKVYINTNISQVEEVLSLIREAAKNAVDFKNEEYVVDDDWRHTIQNNIYFIGIKGKSTGVFLYKDNIVDQKTFETIIRTKIKDVI